MSSNTKFYHLSSLYKKRKNPGIPFLIIALDNPSRKTREMSQYQRLKVNYKYKFRMRFIRNTFPRLKGRI